ncbi:MAG: peptidylprolyl isomerase [Gemmatimonadaceae bacterium]
MRVNHVRIAALIAVVSIAAASLVDAQPATPLTAAQKRAALLDPTKSLWSTRAPAIVTADVETTRGTITIELVRAWAPAGVDRFYNLARAGYYDDSRFYRVIYGYIAQFGIAGDPRVANVWARRKIPADPVREHNLRGTLSYAQFKPTDRTTNVFINLRDNPQLDTLKFAPFARVVQGIDVIDSLYAFYGEYPAAEAPLGNPRRLYGESNKYLDVKFPLLDKIVKVTIRQE